MNIKYIIAPVLFFMTFGCSDLHEKEQNFSPEEYLHSVSKDSLLIPGVGLGKLTLEKTRGVYLFNEKINGYAYINLDIALSYKNSDTLIGITIMNNRTYRTPDGKLIGMNESELINELGKPKSIGTHYKNRSFGTLPTLNYDGMSIYFENSKRTIYLFKE